ncbi:CEAM6 protein, partial [Probosciger aterrimus]|nr:CEAM6 protein [Probosciger aterrimus]
ITERRLVAEGSDVLMHVPDIKNMSITEWEYIRNTTSEIILQHYADEQSPTIYSYQGRVIFYPKNGSLLLQKVQEGDSGIYKATVDLMHGKARTILLEVIKPVPQPKLQCNSSLAGSPIELVCEVLVETVASISWEKDGCLLPPEKHFLFSGNLTKLQTRNGKKLDCSSYSCNISNPISWKEAALDLVIIGLAPPLRAEVGYGHTGPTSSRPPSFIILLCQLRKQRLGCMGRAFLPTVGQRSCLMCFDGVWGFCSSPGFWVLCHLDLHSPTTLITNLLFITLLLHNIQHLHEQGCSELIDVSTSYVIAAAAILASLLLLKLLW